MGFFFLASIAQEPHRLMKSAAGISQYKPDYFPEMRMDGIDKLMSIEFASNQESIDAANLAKDVLQSRYIYMKSKFTN